jgi:hypothetical protein
MFIHLIYKWEEITIIIIQLLQGIQDMSRCTAYIQNHWLCTEGDKYFSYKFSMVRSIHRCNRQLSLLLGEGRRGHWWDSEELCLYSRQLVAKYRPISVSTFACCHHHHHHHHHYHLIILMAPFKHWIFHSMLSFINTWPACMPLQKIQTAMSEMLVFH